MERDYSKDATWRELCENEKEFFRKRLAKAMDEEVWWAASHWEFQFKLWRNEVRKCDGTEKVCVRYPKI